jgi:hypothetical protein
MTGWPIMKNREWNPPSLRFDATRIEDGGWRPQSVLECGSPLPLPEGATVSSGFQSARGLAQSKTSRLLLLFCVLASTFCFRAVGQQYSINWFKVAGGGGTSTGGAYQLSGTIGQPDAGGPMTGGNYSLTGGFWSVITVVQTPGTPLLTITLNSQLPTVTVSWPSSATNFVLQQNSDLTTANWINSGLLVTTNGATLSVIISPPAGNLFFRLKQ